MRQHGRFILRRKSERVLLYFDEFCKGGLFFTFSFHFPIIYALTSLSLSLPSLTLSLSLSRICIEFHHGVKVVLKTVSPVAVLFLQLDHIVDS